jgi:hypothetical protein
VPVDGALETGNRTGAGSYANGKVRVSEVSGQPAEYRGNAAAHEDSTQIYSGWVVKATPSGSELCLQLDNGLVLEELVGGSAELRWMPGAEAIWSVAQWGGLRPEQLHVHGLAALPDQVLVLVPVEGLVLNGELKLGPVTLTTDPSLAAAGLAPLTDSPRKESRLGGSQRQFLSSEGHLIRPQRTLPHPRLGGSGAHSAEFARSFRSEFATLF